MGWKKYNYPADLGNVLFTYKLPVLPEYTICVNMYTNDKPLEILLS